MRSESDCSLKHVDPTVKGIAFKLTALQDTTQCVSFAVVIGDVSRDEW